jgi:hypothetical protein
MFFNDSLIIYDIQFQHLFVVSEEVHKTQLM